MKRECEPTVQLVGNRDGCECLGSPAWVGPPPARWCRPRRTVSQWQSGLPWLVSHQSWRPMRDEKMEEGDYSALHTHGYVRVFTQSTYGAMLAMYMYTQTIYTGPFTYTYTHTCYVHITCTYTTSFVHTHIHCDTHIQTHIVSTCMHSTVLAWLFHESITYNHPPLTALVALGFPWRWPLQPSHSESE